MKFQLKSNRTPLFYVALAGAMFSAVSFAAKELTIVGANGEEKTITLNVDPEVVISYTPTGMKLTFSNIAMKLICIEDPSTDGLCRLQAYDNSAAGGGSQATLPAAPAKPTAAALTGAIKLDWQAPSDGGSPITGYKIMQVAPTMSVVEQNTASTTTSYTVSGLSSSNAYSFSVAAINSKGVGDMSPNSDAVNPAGSGSNSDTLYATACDNTPGNVTCQKIDNGDLEGSSFTQVSIASKKILSIPFRIDSASDGNSRGGFKVQSFDNQNAAAPDSFFEMWLSSSPGSLAYINGGTRALCLISGGYAEATLVWIRGDGGGNPGCYIGSATDDGIVWVNMRFVDINDGSLGAYGPVDFIVL